MIILLLTKHTRTLSLSLSLSLFLTDSFFCALFFSTHLLTGIILNVSIVESINEKEKCILKAKVTSDGSSGLTLLRATYTLVTILMLGFLLIFCLQGKTSRRPDENDRNDKEWERERGPVDQLI